MARRFASTAAFHELLDLIRQGDQAFLEGPRAVDDLSVLEGYRYLTEVLSVALDCFLWADADRPTLVPIVGPTRKFGGDNADAFYHYAALRPDRTYRLSGRRGDACYLSVTVYGGPDDGRWSNRIVGSLNDRAMRIAPDGSFEVVLSRREHAGNWLRLEDDAVCLVTRDYLIDPVAGTKATWAISATEPAPPPRLTDAELARRFQATANFIRELLAITPLPFDPAKANTVDDPYPVPKQTYGWAAGDAAYAMGSFALGHDDALVLEGRSPACAFWNVCLWNPYMQTYDYRYERVTLNGGQVQYGPDGSWRLVVAARDPGVPNWISTAGHPRGVIWFRWFLPESLPARPATRVTTLDAVRG
ncbi:MAG TPA: DUF1214 domain-containing protein [Candidatus Limnocylindria bacterium]|nr:DUF1214 domain-containing protein [Candidatus Limnocylindria bacterium]